MILVSVDDGKTGNSNKYYNMDEDGDVVHCKWGRVGGHESSKDYPIDEYDRIHNEKTRKGYEDVTHLRVTNGNGDAHASGASDNSPEGLFLESLAKFARTSVRNNYIVSFEAVTQAMVDEAQSILSDITGKLNTRAKPNPTPINELLIQLFKVIPRRMTDVHDYLLASGYTIDRVKDLLSHEQDVLDTMAGQVSMNATSSKPVSKSSTLADMMGIRIEEVKDSATVGRIKGMMGSGYDRKLKKVYKVANIKCDKSMCDFKPKLHADKSELMWHGSRNENWFNILQTGLLIRPSGAVYTGSMFGSGIYFSDMYRKSENYTSINGSHWANGRSDVAYIALFEVAVGKQFDVHHADSSLCWETLNRHGCDSVYAHGGADLRNNEFIVFKTQQTAPRFIIEIGD